jgi:hypothetical protein
MRKPIDLLAQRNLMPRKRKNPDPTRFAHSLADIELIASNAGNEIYFGPRKIKIVRTVFTYDPFPEAGPGMWRETYVDEIVEAALEAAALKGLTPSMFRALSAANFEEIDRQRKRVHG